MMYLALKMWFCLLLAALIGLFVGWWLYRSRAVQRELELNNEIDVRNDRVGSLEGKLSARDSKITLLGEDLQQWQAKVPRLESTVAERDDQVMGLTMDLDTWKQKLPPLEARLGVAESERSQLVGDLAERTASLADSEAAMERLDGEVSSLRQSLADVNERQAREVSEFNTELTGQKQQMDNLRVEFDTTTAKAADLETELTALQTDRNTLTNEGRERERALGELRQSLQSQEAERLSLAEQVTTLSPVALRVTSQDQSIASLNQDLRNRDTTIKSLKGEIDTGRNQVEQLKSSEQSLALLRTEMDAMRGELTSTRTSLAAATQVSSAAQDDVQEPEKAQEKVKSNDAEWRARLRIADSGRQQAQADLYRRQEQIERLERKLAAASSEVPQQSALGLLTGAGADSTQAGQVAAIDERQWKSRLRIEESARRKAEADALRGNERVQSLEAQLRQARSDASKTVSSPPVAIPAVPSLVSPSLSTTPTTPTTPTAEAGTNSLDEMRFLTSAPAETDELQKIKGVGKVLEKTLNSLGIYQFRQIALFSADDIAWVDERLKFKGRIERDAWVKQSGKLHRKKYKSEAKAD